MDIKALVKPHSPTVLNEHQAKAFLQEYGIPVVDEHPASDAAQAVRAARDIGYPVVLKGVGVKLQHKTEQGLVHLNLDGEGAVRHAAGQIAAAAGRDLEYFVVQPQVRGQRELMMGLFRDAQFGPVVLFGLGGVTAEALNDICLRLAPLSESDARQMLDGIKARKLLGQFRNQAPVERETLVRSLMALSRIAQAHPEIAEIDINPLCVTPQGEPLAVDALVVIKAPDRSAPPPPAPVAAQAIGALFYPRSIAFVGASARLGKWGHTLLANTLGNGFKGNIYLVNPKGGAIAGRKVYPTLAHIPDPVDLAVVTIPAAGVLDLIPQCREKEVRHMVLISSGFAETGPQGQALEKELVAAARRAGILILGPNTMGIANPHIDLYCTGATVKPEAGDTAVVAQSGNMGTQLLAFAEKQGIGIRGFSGSGNEAMITIEDYIEGFEEDPLTRTVMLYLESTKNGRRFYESARRVTCKKPIVLLKGGQTRAGLKAAATHTGALMSDSRVFNAMCRQAGIIQVDQPMELLDLAAAFASLPMPRGPRVAIMTWGGGWGVVTADLCQQRGLQVPELDREIITHIDEILPPYWSRSNPVDLVGEQDMAIPVNILEALIRWQGCDAVINLGILGRRLFVNRLAACIRAADPDISPDLLDQAGLLTVRFEQDFVAHCVRLMSKYQKPIIGVSFLTDSEDQTIHRVPDAQYQGVFYETPERAVHTLAKMVDYARYLSQCEMNSL